MAGESRTELLRWINSVTQAGITKIEECGTGAIYCQLIDSIFGDLPMTRVKLNARQEYEYINNYKVLQAAFKKHRIDKPIPVERLIKCKMQDNLEFTQWLKKFWDAHWHGEEYDPIGRAGGQVASVANPAVMAVRPASNGGRVSSGSGARRTPVGGPARVTSVASQANQREMLELRAQVEELHNHSATIEKESGFYFGKLRDVEVIVQQRLSMPDTEVSKSERETLLKIQAILYSTEEGFEAPPADELALDGEDKFEHEQLEGGVQQLHVGEQLNVSRGSHAGEEHEGQLLQEEETF
ncbi:hypothetical protein QFC21_003003 [Naganishia friedmannii]|uniref:Uncharacterized protein n=1 Tax=Naganishia friedmannii TaxID=89922 RepID=A0ACC2VVZ2_9TREE|nr:hypothetical protein QFC21_003003 [Naganishia friedmannii]